MIGPERIGRYRILEKLGEGAMGVVYLGEDPKIGRKLALKVLSPGPGGDEGDVAEFAARFQREGRIAGGLAHPNIVVIYDVGEDPQSGRPYIAMEYVEGQTLQRMLAKGLRFTPQNASRLVRQVADALDYAHAQGVVHRDIKPGNLLILRGGVVKITDFGIARVGASSELTRTGQLVGTPNYMSPEQVVGSALDGRADLFSLGIIYYLLLTGERPFGGENLTSISYKIVNVEPVPPSRLVPTLAPHYDTVVLRMLAKRPEARYPTGRQIVEALDAMPEDRPPIPTTGAGAQEFATVAAARPPAPLHLPRARDRALMMALLLVLAVAATISWITLGHSGGAPGGAQGGSPGGSPGAAYGESGTSGAMAEETGATPGPTGARIETPAPRPPGGDGVPRRTRPGPAPAAAPVPRASPGAPPVPGASPGKAAPAGHPEAPAGEPARVAVTFRHRIGRGSLAILVDGRPVLQADLSRENRGVRKDLFEGQFVVPPGRHTITARLQEAGESALEETQGGLLFTPGEAATLELHVGRLGRIRKLNLYWK